MLFINIFYIILIIFWLTILQKFYYIILHKIKLFNKYLSFFYAFIIRFWVIIHELCHLFFALVTWNKVSGIELFKKNWWQITLLTKNYIWELPKYWFSFNFLFLLILNQIWIFLVSFWPLLFWLLTTYIIFYFIWINNFEDILNLKFDFILSVYLFLFSIFIPSFILSFEDIKGFFISKQDNFLRTFMASFINTFLFFWFLFLFWDLLYDYLLIFSILFFFMFLLQLLFYIVFFLLSNIKKILLN